MVHTHAQAVADEVVELLGADPDRVRAVAPGIDLGVDPGVGDGPGSAAGGVPARRVVQPARGWPEPAVPTCWRWAGSSPARTCPAWSGRSTPSPPPTPTSIWSSPGRRAGPRTHWSPPWIAAHHRDRLHRLGWLGDAEKADLLRGASVFAYPSVYEGFGLPPLEAMAARVPVVATAAGGLAEAVGDAAVVVPVGDTDALAAALESVLDDDERRARLVTAGVQQVGRFTWDRSAAGLHALYLDAAGDRALVSRR